MLNLSRKTFFDTLLTKRSNITTTLKPHTNPLTKSDAYHLVKRTCFKVDPLFVNQLVGKTAEQAVDLIFNNFGKKSIPTPNFQLNYAYLNPNNIADYQKREELSIDNTLKILAHNETLVEWWFNEMLKDSISIEEKLVFFLHGHFTTQYEPERIPATWMYRQNLLFRDVAFKNLQNIISRITLDGAMLQYLNGNSSVAGAANENFARELLELYTVGIGNGHYSENDVREIARMLTGWKTNHYQFEGELYSVNFHSDLFDSGTKTVFDTTLSFEKEVNEENNKKYSIETLANLILEKRALEVSTFFAYKLYSYFVYQNPNRSDSIILSIAKHFRENSFNIKSTIKKILMSSHFYDQANRGIMIKSPLENLVNFIGHFPPNDGLVSLNTILKRFGQVPFNPPNVSGWTGYRSWITTSTLPKYIGFFNKIIADKSSSEIGLWASSLDGFDSSYELVESMALLFFGRLPKEDRLKKVENALLGGAPYYEWKSLAANRENAGLRVKVALKEMIKMPEFFLT